MNSKTIQEFNPTILYAFDAWNHAGNHGEKHHHDFFEMSIILEGEVEYFFNQNWQTVRGGQILLFDPGVEHCEKQLANTFSHQLHIGIEHFQFENQPADSFGNDQVLLPVQEDQVKIFDKAWQLLNEFQQHPSSFDLISKGLVLEIMGLTWRCLVKRQQQAQSSLSKSDRFNQVIQLIIAYMENNYAQDISIEQLATTHFISPTYLSKIFKEVTGVSPINYLIQIRLEKAFQLLETDEYSIKEVAKAVGYEDAYHFSKSFKKQYGQSPSKIRQEFQQKNKTSS
ncbi:MAG TPA: AraC family transcriptional regulator [Candidatus Tetragenococcus pullicola]|nr:AraC family transcriptional regulator [Candidatus Tetragenococcus pullicola]